MLRDGAFPFAYVPCKLKTGADCWGPGDGDCEKLGVEFDMDNAGANGLFDLMTIIIDQIKAAETP